MSENNPHRESMQMLNVTLSLSGVSVLLFSVVMHCTVFSFIFLVLGLHGSKAACQNSCMHICHFLDTQNVLA